MDAPQPSPSPRRPRGKLAAGCLVRACFPGGPRYLIVHPSGNYNRRAPWSIPKGEPEPDEPLESCARRETEEETGIRCRIVAPLGEARYTKSRKTIHAFLAEPLEPVAAAVIEPASWEVDRVEFCDAAEALSRLHPDQRVFVERAEAFGSASPPCGP
jgi:8-oxo-dGTP pyrophosphatase MutT (NUDIX family)